MRKLVTSKMAGLAQPCSGVFRLTNELALLTRAHQSSRDCIKKCRVHRLAARQNQEKTKLSVKMYSAFSGVELLATMRIRAHPSLIRWYGLYCVRGRSEIREQTHFLKVFAFPAYEPRAFGPNFHVHDHYGCCECFGFPRSQFW